MAAIIGQREFEVRITDQMILDAVSTWTPKHADAPNETELCDLRKIIGRRSGVANIEMVSLVWLRNIFVQCRKTTGAKTGNSQEPKGLF